MLNLLITLFDEGIKVESLFETDILWASFHKC